MFPVDTDCFIPALKRVHKCFVDEMVNNLEKQTLEKSWKRWKRKETSLDTWDYTHQGEGSGINLTPQFLLDFLLPHEWSLTQTTNKCRGPGQKRLENTFSSQCNKSNLPAGMSREVAEKESTYIVFMQHSDFINFDIYKLMIYVQNE